MLVAMSRLILKPNFAALSNAILEDTVSWNAIQIRRTWIYLSLLVLATPFCWSSLSLAQQNDRSVLVYEGSENSAGSNAQVELEADWPPESIPASTQPFLPPSPPASMTADSDNTASFRPASQGSPESASTTSPTQPTLEPLRADRHDDESVMATSATLPSPDSGTFVSRLPGDFGQQGNNSFGTSPASSDLRSNSASSSSRNRFGDFGASPAPRASSRFAPISASPNNKSKASETASPTPPPANRFPQPAVNPASTQQPLRPAATNNRFGSPAPATGDRFAQLSQPKAAAPQTGPPSAPSITTRPISTPPVSSRTNSTLPQASTQSVTSLNDSSQAGGRFPAAPNRFAKSPPSSSLQPNSRQPNPRQPSSLQSSSRQSNTLGDSNLKPTSDSSSRSIVSSGSGQNSNNSSTPMIRRQANSSSALSLPRSSGTEQSNSRISSLAPQSRGFANQPNQQPLRRSQSNNDLRSKTSNNQSSQSSLTQRPAQSNNQNLSGGAQSSGKADRASINFAKQQLRNIQAASVDESGTPVRLQEMLLEPLTGSQRKQMVAQYWETYYDLAALKITADYEGWLNSISTSGSETGLLSAAQRMAADQKLAAKIQLGKSKSRLMDFMPNPRPNEFSPLPSDEPLVEHYVTDYEKYKRVRTLPSSLRGIDPMLASTLKLITQRAATASMAKKAADQAGQAVRNRQIPLASAIAAGDLWRDSQLDMVASTVSYNQAISDFVLTLEPNRSPEQLTAFMLGAPKNNPQSSSTSPQNQSQRNAANQQGFSTNRSLYR